MAQNGLDLFFLQAAIVMTFAQRRPAHLGNGVFTSVNVRVICCRIVLDLIVLNLGTGICYASICYASICYASIALGRGILCTVTALAVALMGTAIGTVAMLRFF